MEYDFIPKRITELRIKKGVSEYQMSLELGHNKNYIQNISSGKAKISIVEFLYVCEYLGVTPQAFFDEEEAEPILVQKALDGMRGLSDRDLLTLIGLIDRLKQNQP